MAPRTLVLTLLLFFGLVPAALAAPRSEITSPSDPVHTFAGGSEKVGDSILVEGTATDMPGSVVDLVCFPTDGNLPANVADDAPVSEGQFSATVNLTNGSVPGPCILRAIPDGGIPADRQPFVGLRVLPTTYAGRWLTPDDLQYDYEWTFYGTRGNFDVYSPGDGAVGWTQVVDPSTLNPASDSVAANVFALFDSDGTSQQAPMRSEIMVDGAPAYTPYEAVWLGVGPPKYSNPGLPEETVLAESFDPDTGETTVVTNEPIVKCSPSTDWASNYNNTAGSCTKFLGTGVVLERTLVTGANGQALSVTDRWRSPGSKPHQIDVLYDNRFSGTSGPATSGFRFPGDSAFGVPAYNAVIALPEGPGTAYYKSDISSPDSGGDNKTQAALSWSSRPETFRFIQSELTNDYAPEFTMGYQRTVPARGSVALSFQLAQGTGQPDLQAIARAFESQFPRPVAPSAPAAPQTQTQTQTQTQNGTPSVAAADLKRGKVRTRWSGSRIVVETGQVGTCSAGTGSCSFVFRAKLGRNTIGKGTIKVAAGRSAKIAFKLSKRWTKQLQRKRRLRLALRVTPNGRPATTRKITIRAPKRR